MKKGFTLIELLVVVLIIGILSAVAVPQYTKAVEKSRLSSMLPLLRSIAEAKKIYYMSTGEHARTFDVLDVSLPAGTIVTDNSYYGQNATHGKIHIWLDAGGNEVVGVLYLSDSSSLLYYIPIKATAQYHTCYGTIGKRADTLCKSLPGAVYIGIGGSDQTLHGYQLKG